MKKPSVIHKIITILTQNYIYGCETVEMGLLDCAFLDLGKFFYLDKERINWFVTHTIRFFENPVCILFFAVNWLQKFGENTTPSMEIHCADLLVWHLYTGLPFCDCTNPNR